MTPPVDTDIVGTLALKGYEGTREIRETNMQHCERTTLCGPVHRPYRIFRWGSRAASGGARPIGLVLSALVLVGLGSACASSPDIPPPQVPQAPPPPRPEASPQPPPKPKPKVQPAAPNPLDKLQAKAASVTWDRESQLETHFNADDHQDYVILGTYDQSFVVGVVLGPADATAETFILAFTVGQNTEDSLCAATANLFVERPGLPLSILGCTDAPSEPCVNYAQNNAWFEAHPTVQGVRIDDGACDSIHLYWDAATESVAWWRR